MMQQNEGGQRENRPRGDRAAGRSAGGHDVVFENIGPTEQRQHPHGNDRGGNRGGDGESGEQAHISVGGRQDHRQNDRKKDRLQRQLRRGYRAHPVSRPASSASCLARAAILSLSNKAAMSIPISYKRYIGTAIALCETASGGVTKAAKMKIPSRMNPRFFLSVANLTNPVHTNNTVATGTSNAKPNASSKIMTKSR